MDKRDRYDSLFQYYASLHPPLDWRLVKAQAIVESSLDPDARNPSSGAVGLGQFMPRTWDEWQDGRPGIASIPGTDGRMIHPKDPEDAIAAMCAYDHWLIARFPLYTLADQIKLALAAYNWGIGNVLTASRNIGTAAGILDACPLETREYVPRILTIYHDSQGE